jgi:DNA replicative helicase MCM subunit Mcm2 (Cdc46/Mcm family)
MLYSCHCGIMFYEILLVDVNISCHLLQRLAKHVMNVHLNALQMTEEPAEGEIDLMTLKKYINYSRK